MTLGLKVLYIDDQEFNRKIMKGMFLKEKGKIDLAGNGKEGLEIFKRNQNYYDLVITDLRMPIMRYISFMVNLMAVDKP
jgi:CheY-like chemotaxis protein